MIDKVEIEQIKQRTNLEEYIRSQGIKLRKKGKQFFGQCPFHQDSNPSMSVDPQKQLWNCFGCQQGGDIYEFVIKLKGVDFLAAHQLLGGVANLSPIKEATKDNATPEQEKEAAKEELSVESLKWLDLAAKHYHTRLLETPQAQEYLLSRGISLEAIRIFQLGYSDGTLSSKLSNEGKAALEEIGVLTAAGKELMKGCVIFPLLKADTPMVVSLYGRHTRLVQHLYLPGKHRGLVNQQAAEGSNEIILVESIIDSLALWSVGIRNVIPIYGTNGLTDDIISHLRQCLVKHAILMLDNDLAGQKAANLIKSRLDKENIYSSIVELPAKDPSEWVSKGATKDAILALLPKLPSTANDKSINPPKLERTDEEIAVTFGSREYQIRGLQINGLDRMKINMKVKHNDNFHLDTMDLYQEQARKRFAERASERIQAPEQEIESQLLLIIEELEKIRLQAKQANKKNPPKVAISASEQQEALEYLRNKDLVSNIALDILASGLIGERATILMAYLCALSRKLAKPLSCLVVARSGAGKSSLQEAICSFLPPEDIVWVTRLTGQALFYKDPNSLKNKVLAIAEEEGASQAIYSLRTLASDQRLSVAVTQTSPQTGELQTKHYNIFGPVSILTTTTSAEAFDEETRSRFVLLTMDESQQQTKAILEQQRYSRSLEGVLEIATGEQKRLLHHNCQRLLKPLKVVNPFVELLEYPSQKLIARREHTKYLTLIDTIALLHQYQREIKTATSGKTTIEYVEVELEDIALANELASSVLWRSFDELAPPVRGMKQEIEALYNKKAKEKGIRVSDIALSRREIRIATNWTDWQVRQYCQKLVDMEYLTISFSSNGKSSLYKIIEPLEESLPKISNLKTVEELREQLKEKSLSAVR